MLIFKKSYHKTGKRLRHHFMITVLQS